MAWDGKQKVRSTKNAAKSDIFDSLAPIYHMSKICGLVPVQFTQDENGRYRGRLSFPIHIYGILLMSGFVGAQIWGLYRDLRDGWRSSTRLSSESGITITCGDVYAVISVVIVSILGSPYRWKYLNEALNKVADVDERLGVQTSKNLRRVSILVIILSIAYIVTLGAIDFLSWTLATETKDNKGFGDKGPINYSPLHFMYVVIMIFELQYALIMFNVGERFLKMNKVLKNIIMTNLVIQYLRKDVGLDVSNATLSEASQTSLIIPNFSRIRIRRKNKISDICSVKECAWGAWKAIDHLITVHWTLCDSIHNINRAYGGVILTSMISCLVHLIITPYFLYIEVYRNNNGSIGVLIIQVLWTMFHIYRLLLFVQPCHRITVEVEKSGVLVSQALIQKWDHEAKKRLDMFSLQLLHRPVKFTAWGLFSLDRTLITSVMIFLTFYTPFLLFGIANGIFL
ncbi:hypothetical protein QAD02_009731 [Eretmocerus hayati]|uniref:Uncharacterized protein n=1 Tax=Eretmocerus hayati TaxID=131215 RepID=A0ACC2NAV6_9HYME|nr:hypothetical protein QAD02_009731 [Eretmocerus hayati]